MLAGLLCTRTLYDKEMLQAIRMSNGLGGRADPLVSDDARSEATQEPAADAKLQRRYFRPPPLRLSRCARSLFAISLSFSSPKPKSAAEVARERPVEVAVDPAELPLSGEAKVSWRAHFRSPERTSARV